MSKFEKPESKLQRVVERLFHVKMTISQEEFQSLVRDLEWYRDLKQKDESGEEHDPDLWKSMNSTYNSMTVEELNTLIDRLRAD